ncbi:hypothetical protein [Rummeliibacillus sp. POC4]|uniref:hypothetical protein n=1 Tax=Rummeliibacillus sp. POC4 TaxID=2305899 RepID=UPI000E668190|nr:hypothetical protein [Rummeliibacillus sp. POC4]RIJ63111.1 hypothetical protein D1606_16655 [Rummeliibacillus sp. POC4]
MNVTVQKWVFNPSLMGKAVKIIGYDYDGTKLDGIYIIKKIDNDKITLINHKGEIDLFVSNIYGDIKERFINDFEVIETEDI